jgi:hypothetical protein
MAYGKDPKNWPQPKKINYDNDSSCDELEIDRFDECLF